MQIEGKRVLVTGASRGLGRTVAFAFAAAAASEVFAGVRKAADLERIQAEAASCGAAITPLKLDVTVAEDVEQAAARLGAVDILINNAGVAGFGNPLTMPFEMIEQEMAVNYFGVLRMVRAFAPTMVQQKEGMIVNVATAFSKVNLPIVGTYCATKAALLSLGQALRAYLLDSGVGVITVMPTTIDTEMSSGAEVPKLSKEFVAAEILESIREQRHDPPIGDEARGILAGLATDSLAIEKMFARYRAEF